MDVGLLIWLRQEAVVQTYSNALAVSPAMVAPADPERFLCIFRPDSAINILVGFGDRSQTPRSYILVPSAGNLQVDEVNLGDYINLPIVASAASATPTLLITTLSYNGNRRKIYNELIRKQLSDPGAFRDDRPR